MIAQSNLVSQSKHLYRKRDRNVSPNRADSANDESLQTTITKAVTCEDSDSDVPLLNRNTRSNGNRLYMPISKMKDRIKSEGDSKEGLHVPLLENARKEGNTENDAPGQSPGSQGQEGDTTGNEWWNESDKHDGIIKWKTLEHNGVLFPPPYAPLPADVKMKYDGIPITLEPEVEEIACFFGEMLDATHYVENPTFRKNFFEDFQKTIKRTSGARNPQGRVLQIETLAKCDFSSIFEYFQMRKAQRKAEPLAQRKEQKAARDALEEPFRLCIWDGQPQKVGNFRIEPPGLFRGRGDHPRNGKVKTRVSPEQVTLNLSKNANVPLPPVEHQWKDIKHDQEATWLAMWKENVNGNYKYVMLAANSNVRGQSDYKKFETSRRLKQHIDRIRHDYQQGLRHELMKIRQLATAMYLIDKLALRAGNEKGEGEADTVGCCSLKYENVTLKPPNTVVLDFLGKDSIRFYDEVGVDRQVFKNFKIFKKFPKKEGDEIFDRLTVCRYSIWTMKQQHSNLFNQTSGLNRHLSNYMPGLTAKVFRTFNASFIFSNLLKTIKPEASVTEKVKAYNDANRTVAILCNHKRGITASHSAQIEKLYDRVSQPRPHNSIHNTYSPLVGKSNTIRALASQENDA